MLTYDAMVRINGEMMYGSVFASQMEPIVHVVYPGLIEKYYQLFDVTEFEFCGVADKEMGAFFPKCEVKFCISDKDVTLTVTSKKTGEEILSCAKPIGDNNA